LKQRPKPVAHSERSEESQVHSESVAETRISPEMFRYAQHDNGC